MKARKILNRFESGDYFTSITCSFLLVVVSWSLCLGLQKMGLPFPEIPANKFVDLGFLTISNFSFITFLAMAPIQTAEGKLSHGFYAQIVKQPWSHFGLHILISCFIFCLLALSLQGRMVSEERLSPLFVAIAVSMIFAMFYHRNRTFRYLSEPKIVYENLANLAEEETAEELWLDLYECTLKAIKDNRVSDARNFSNLMAKIYPKIKDKEMIGNLHEDLKSLYQAAKDIHPIASEFAKHWSFLQFKTTTVTSKTLSQALEGMVK